MQNWFNERKSRVKKNIECRVHALFYEKMRKELKKLIGDVEFKKFIATFNQSLDEDELIKEFKALQRCY